MLADLAFARQHLFHDSLRDSDVDWPTVFRGFNAVTRTQVDEACSTIPSAWAEVGKDVLGHVTAVLDRWPQFEQEIALSLGHTQ